MLAGLNPISWVGVRLPMTAEESEPSWVECRPLIEVELKPATCPTLKAPSCVVEKAPRSWVNRRYLLRRTANTTAGK